MTLRDTIAAIATPPGIGGIGLIRVSGPTALGIAQRLFCPLPLGNFLSHHLYHGRIIAPATGAVLDEVLVDGVLAGRLAEAVPLRLHHEAVVREPHPALFVVSGLRLLDRGGDTEHAAVVDHLLVDGVVEAHGSRREVLQHRLGFRCALGWWSLLGGHPILPVFHSTGSAVDNGAS